MATISLTVGDRVLLRDRPWRVRKVSVAADRHHIVEVEALDGDFPGELSVAVPPEEVERLPSEAVEFAVDPLQAISGAQPDAMGCREVKDGQALGNGRLKPT